MDLSLQRIQGASWAEEMEILQPQGDEDLYGSVKSKTPTRVARATPATEALLKQSFVSPINEDHVDERNVYALPKVRSCDEDASLDKVMATHYSKSTKTNDWTLSRIQALTLDPLAPLTSILELFNLDAEEIQSEVVAKAVESAVVMLGNASSHISSLQRTKQLEEYNKDATIHLAQVTALWKAR